MLKGAIKLATPYYTVQETTIYAFTFVLTALLIYRIVRKIGINIDWKFALSISPYIFVAAILRVTQDIGVYDSYWLVTPGIFILMLSILSIIMSLGLFLEKKKEIPYFKIVFIIGIILLAALSTLLKPKSLSPLIDVLILTLPATLLFVIRWDFVNKLVTFVQLFDALVTYVAVTKYGWVEKHVIPSLLFSFSPFSFVLVKLSTVFTILLLMDKTIKGDFRSYLKLLIAVMGGATGVRDILALMCLG